VTLEEKRLARLRELSRDARRSERTLERAIRAALERGISVRKVAEAVGWDGMRVWRLTKTGSRMAEQTRKASGRAANVRADTEVSRKRPNGSTKPKTEGK